MSSPLNGNFGWEHGCGSELSTPHWIVEWVLQSSAWSSNPAMANGFLKGKIMWLKSWRETNLIFKNFDVWSRDDFLCTDGYFPSHVWWPVLDGFQGVWSDSDWKIGILTKWVSCGGFYRWWYPDYSLEALAAKPAQASSDWRSFSEVSKDFHFGLCFFSASGALLLITSQRWPVVCATKMFVCSRYIWKYLVEIQFSGIPASSLLLPPKSWCQRTPQDLRTATLTSMVMPSALRISWPWMRSSPEPPSCLGFGMIRRPRGGGWAAALDCGRVSDPFPWVIPTHVTLTAQWMFGVSKCHPLRALRVLREEQHAFQQFVWTDALQMGCSGNTMILT